MEGTGEVWARLGRIKLYWAEEGDHVALLFTVLVQAGGDAPRFLIGWAVN